MTDRRPTHILSSYFAPRGAHRMYALGQQIAQMYLSLNDKLIGVGENSHELLKKPDIKQQRPGWN